MVSERGKKDTATALDDTEKARLLRSSFIFRDLDDTLLGRLARLSQTRRLAKGTLLFHQGEEGDALYGVAEGLIRIWRSEEHTSELQSLMRISYADFCLKKLSKHST